jgi:hypothetical protein
LAQRAQSYANGHRPGAGSVLMRGTGHRTHAQPFRTTADAWRDLQLLCSGPKSSATSPRSVTTDMALHLSEVKGELRMVARSRFWNPVLMICWPRSGGGLAPSISPIQAATDRQSSPDDRPADSAWRSRRRWPSAWFLSIWENSRPDGPSLHLRKPGHSQGLPHLFAIGWREAPHAVIGVRLADSETGSQFQE